MSALASVVSDGSPGSILLIDEDDGASPLLSLPCPASAIVPARVRARFDGGTAAAAVVVSVEWTDLRVLGTAAGVADSSPSSPDASRDDGWSWSAADSLGAGTAARLEELRFRLVVGEMEAIVSCRVVSTRGTDRWAAPSALKANFRARSKWSDRNVSKDEFWR